MSAVDILSSLVEKGKTLVETRYNDGRQSEFYSSVNNGDFYKGKIVVLINENSASASEIVA
jgi:carboxyl-terminal processing protease